MNPPWDPWKLMEPVNPMVSGQDVLDGVLAVSAALDFLDIGDNDGMVVFRQPRAVVFLPWLQHRHTPECNRA